MNNGVIFYDIDSLIYHNMGKDNDTPSLAIDRTSKPFRLVPAIS